jgi:hypothetical protein
VGQAVELAAIRVVLHDISARAHHAWDKARGEPGDSECPK